MTIEEIKENPEKALELIEAGDKNVERISQLESINASLVDQKKELKEKIANGSGDEALKAELQNYKDQLAAVENDKAELTKTFNSDLNKLRVEGILKDLKVKGVNDVSTDAIIKSVMEGAEFKDGELIYLNEDGTTAFNEVTRLPVSALDRINDLKDNPKTATLFEAPKGAGGGNGSASNLPKDKSKMTDDERAADLAERAASNQKLTA